MSIFDELNNEGNVATFPSGFQNSPFGESWNKNLPSWAVNDFSSSNVVKKGSLKVFDNTQKFNNSDLNKYLFFAGDLQFDVEIFVRDKGLELLKLYEKSKSEAIPPNKIYLFVEYENGKIDLGRVIRVRLGSNVVKELEKRFLIFGTDEEDLAEYVL